MKLCDYGCGEEAHYQFKNGKGCCKEKWEFCCSSKIRAKEKANIQWNNTNSRKRASISATKRFKRKEERILQSKRMKQRFINDLSLRRRISTSVKIRFENIEERKKLSVAIKKALSKKETKIKMSLSQKKRFKKKEEREKAISLGMLGKNHSNETKKKMRLARIFEIEKKHGQISPNYNPKACKVIDKYGKKNNYKFQHAENGGEFYIKELGYWVDGYDKEKNVVIEIDEKYHFDVKRKQEKKDLQRQKEIEKYLNCIFIRLKI